MEPVPETERMEEFRTSPLPRLRLQSSSNSNFTSASPLSPRSPIDADDYLRKPPAIRRSNEPTSPISPSWAPSPALSYRPRATSPLSGHMRSRSTASIGSLFPPPMGRTQSMPGVNGSGHLQFILDPRKSSPSLHRPTAITTRTPKKALMEDVFPSSPTRVSIFQDADRPVFERSSSPNLGVCSPSPGISKPPAIASLPVIRSRRPSSPYRRISNPSSSASFSNMLTSAPTSAPFVAATPTSTAYTFPGDTSPSSTASSPSYRPFDSSVPSLSASVSSYGGLGILSSSSVPSTPTSTRSRSPSISSLETIPDSPDAEEAALQAERIAQLKAAADAADGEAKGRGSLDVPARGRTLASGSRDKRKRWSVCGAERRGDLDLETIWED